MTILCVCKHFGPRGDVHRRPDYLRYMLISGCGYGHGVCDINEVACVPAIFALCDSKRHAPTPSSSSRRPEIVRGGERAPHGGNDLHARPTYHRIRDPSTLTS